MAEQSAAPATRSAPGPGGSSPSAAGTPHRTLHTTRDDDGRVTATTRLTTLPSGLRVVTEQMAGARSASVGVWVGVGSRDEADGEHGCSHFLEHLLFKGTPERTALDLSVALDAVGGEMNAFTAQEYTCFHVRVLDRDLPLAVDVLGDMVTGALIEPEDVEAERDVILDEIAMHDDDPDDVAHHLVVGRAWGSGPGLGRPVAGTADSIEALTRDDVVAFRDRHYRPESMVVAAAGHLDHDDVVAQVERCFGRHGFLDGDADPAPPRRSLRAVGFRSGEVGARRPFEQATLVQAWEGLARGDERRYALGVLNTALGGGTSSRLFQEVRERRGLAYSVYSWAAHHSDAGLVGLSVGCLPERLDDILDVVGREVGRVARDGLEDAEVERGVSQLSGALLLGLEDSEARMHRIGKACLVDQEVRSVEEVLTRIEAVTPEAVHALVGPVLDAPSVRAVVGPQRG